MASTMHQDYQQSSLQWPAGIPQDSMPAGPFTLVFPTQTDGPMCAMYLQFAESSGIDGFSGFAMPICGQLRSFDALPSPPPTATPLTAETPSELKPRNSNRTSRATRKARRHGKLCQRNKGTQALAPLPKLQPKNLKPIDSKATKPEQSGRVEFDTEVDRLLRAIHREDPKGATAVEEEPLVLTSAPLLKEEPMSRIPPIPAKIFRCTEPGCNKVFSQKGHLTTHTRVHTGEKPYPCEFPGCDQYFTQAGNMKSHMRRHNGEKPFKCSFCDKWFTQRSITKTHEKTHDDKKPFECILEGCSKRFTLRGNMKSHLNSVHSDALVELTTKFVGFAKQGRVPEEYRKLQDSFTEHFKNSNKGIKGRGKARKVACRVAQRELIAVDKPTTTEVDESSEDSELKFEAESPWKPQSPSDFGNYAPPSPISVAGQIFPEQDYSSPVAADTPYY